MIRSLLLVILVSLPIFVFSPVTRAAGARSASSFAAFETSPILVNVLYRYGRTTAASNGAYGANAHATRNSWYVEEQRAGATDVIAGVVRGDAALVSDGLRMFHFALAREASNGSFPGAHWPFHGTAMLFADAGPALIVLKSSNMASRFRAETSWQSKQMQRAAYYMIRSIGGAGKIDDTTKNHRFFEAATALQAAGMLAGDGTLQRWSQTYVREGIRMERSNGVMPEDGGHDSGYQAIGLIDAARYLALVPHGSLHDQLYAAVSHGESWELSRVRKNGTINQSGDTRTAGCQERGPSGHCKSVFYAPIFSALGRWAVLSHNARFEHAAYLVWLQNWAAQSGDVLPKAGLWAQPSRVSPGSWLTVWGTRFQPLETVRVYIGSRLMETVSADQIGSFGGHSPNPNAHFVVPALGSGKYTVTARGSLGTTRYTSITVVG